MNDRIEELAEQAAEFANADEYAGIERRIWQNVFRNKFAELIVRECANYMYETYPETRYKVNYMRKHMGDPQWNESITPNTNVFSGCPPEENEPNMFSKYDGDGW